MPKKTEAAIAMRATSVTSNTTGTSANLGPGAATKDSDIMIAALFSADNPTAVTAPTGWTAIGAACVSGTGQGITNLRFYWRKKLAGDTNWTWSWTTSGPYMLSITSYAGVNYTTPIHATPATFCAAGTGTALSANPLTTTVANTLVVGAWSTGNSNSATTHIITPAASPAVIERYGYSGGYNYSCGLLCTNTKQYEYSYSDSFQVAASSPGTFSRAATSNVSSPWTGTNFALAPAADAVLTQSAYRWFANGDSAQPFQPIVSNPTGGADNALVSTQDIANGHLYIAGYDSTGSNQWRIEKRNIQTGNLCTAAECGTLFGTAGVITNDPNVLGDDKIHNMVLDVGGGFLYAVGFDSAGGNQWRIEKRLLSTGALVSGFGSGGVITNNPTAGNDKSKAVAVDLAGGYMYAGGFESTNGIQWRLEKRNLSDGALVSAFGGSGCATNVAGVLCYNGSAGIDELLTVKVDSTGAFLFVSGYDGTSNNQWNLQKRRADTGALCTAAECGTAFDTDGIVIVNPSTENDLLWDNDLDNVNGKMILTGYDSQNGVGNYSMRLEKRNMSDGSLDSTFGNIGCLTNTPGVLCNNPTAGLDQLYSSELDIAGGFMYSTGFDSNNGNEWYTEKRNLSTGARDLSFDTDGIVTSNPTAGSDQASDLLLDTTRGVLWVIGNDSNGGNQWRIERYSTNDGSIALAAQDTAASKIRSGDTFRLEMLLHVATAELLIDVVQFKLQYAVKSGGTCGVYGDVGTAAGDIRYYNNPTPVDGALTTAAPGQPVHGVDGNQSQTYEESNNFTNAYIVPVGTDGLWDFSLTNFSAPANTTYCFRTVKSDNSVITYGVTPELTTSPITSEQSAYRWTGNVNSADLLSVVTNPGATTDDQINATAVDGTNGYVYTAGYDSSPGSNQWRIEKRRTGDGNLCTAATCGTQFGTNGVVTQNIAGSTDEQINAIALDVAGGFIYVAGFDSAGASSTRWRVEKRNASDGALASGFTTVTEDVASSTDERIQAITIDTANAYMYLGGYDLIGGDRQWRVEKRTLSTGALETAFNTTGIISGYSGADSAKVDEVNSIVIDSAGTSIYIGGVDNTPPSAGKVQWRVEKRVATSGALGTNFGGTGICTTAGVYCIDPNTNGDDQVTSLAIDATYLFVGGFDEIATGNSQWRVQRIALASNTDTTILSGDNPSSGIDAIDGLFSDGTNLYIVGYSANNGNEWRFMKRTVAGVVVSGFGDANGAVISNPTAGDDKPTSLAVDTTGGYIYGGGYDSTGGNQWRLERRKTSDGLSGWVPAALASQNTKALPAGGTAFRLRMLLHIGGDNVPISGQAYKLQVSQKSGTCDSAFIGETYADLSPSTGDIRYYDNSDIADGSTITTSSVDPSHDTDPIVAQSYEETNDFTNPAKINILLDGLWDFAFTDDSGFGNYCFRAVKSNDALLETYTQIPEVALCDRPKTDNLLRGGNFFCDGSKKKFYWSL